MNQQLLNKSGENLEATKDYVLDEYPEDMSIREKTQRGVELSDYEKGELAKITYHENIAAQMKAMTPEELKQAEQFAEAVRGLGGLVVAAETYPIVDDPRLEATGWYGGPHEGKIG